MADNNWSPFYPTVFYPAQESVVLQRGIVNSLRDLARELSSRPTTDNADHSLTILEGLRQNNNDWETIEACFDRMSDDFCKINSQLNNISEQIANLTSQLEWNLGLIHEELQRQSETLLTIALQQKIPNELQAREQYDNAKTLANQWVRRFTGHALTAEQSNSLFKASIERFQLALSFLPSGNLSYAILIEMGELCMAANCLDYAKKYLEESIPYAPNFGYVSYSNRLLARIAFSQGNTELAIDYIQISVKYSPNYAIGWYDLAQYYAQAWAQTENEDFKQRALEALKKAIALKKGFWYLAAHEPNFTPIKNDVEQLRQTILDNERAWKFSGNLENLQALEKELKLWLPMEETVMQLGNYTYYSYSKYDTQFNLENDMASKIQVADLVRKVMRLNGYSSGGGFRLHLSDSDYARSLISLIPDEKALGDYRQLRDWCSKMIWTCRVIKYWQQAVQVTRSLYITNDIKTVFEATAITELCAAGDILCKKAKKDWENGLTQAKSLIQSFRSTNLCQSAADTVRILKEVKGVLNNPFPPYKPKNTVLRKWDEIDVHSQYDRVVFIKNCYNQLNLDLKNWDEGNGSPLQLWEFTRDLNQQWHIVPVEPNSSIVYIVSVFSGKNIDLADGNLDEGARIQMWGSEGINSNQLWRFIQQDDGSYAIQSTLSNLFLGLSGYNCEKGAIVNLQYWSGEFSQKWLIYNVQ